jgi:regulator of protease activity HflC (stomatin/prohibitin superfamily)
LGLCGSFAIGYWAAGPLGLLTIMLPAWILFWLLMYLISGFLLPPRDGRKQRSLAFHSLVSFSLGTNRPYYVLEDREIVKRVEGSTFGQLFADPGIILTGPAHAAVIWDGLNFRDIGDPGLTFLGRFEQIYQTVDLRPQLRSFHVEAITKDGIRFRVLTFTPFRLNNGGQSPKKDGSFPLDKQRIYQAVWQQPVEGGEKRAWDEVVQIIATRILRRIIGEYRCDELCEAQDPARDPRIEIRNRLVEELGRELVDYGIDLIGGGISNLVPMDDDVIEKRIAAWQADWGRRIQVELGEGQANAIWEVEQAHAQAQAALLSTIRKVVQERPELDPEMLSKMAALRFVEALEDMACQPQVQEALPSGSEQTISFVRRLLD